MSSLISDFPDRLSPMLVKELRQGLRAKTFIAVFLSLQFTLAFILFISSLAASSDNAGGVISNVIFIFFSIAVLIVQPLRGIGAISSEVRGNTIDMMVLTRLSASRIVFGKWFAIVSQSGLLFTTIIPYLILRYFFGGMNLVGEIMLLLLIFGFSIVLTAITVGLSGCSNVFIRALLPVIAIPLCIGGLLISIFESQYTIRKLIEFCSLNDETSRLILGGLIVGSVYLGWSLLSLGASMIAPAAENLSLWRRLITLAIAIIAALFCAFSTTLNIELLPLIFAIIAAPAIVIALTEPVNHVPSVREAFLKRGLPGKIGGSFLSPGWPSGVIFTGILSAICIAAHLSRAGEGYESGATRNIVSLSFLGALLFPAVILILSRSDDRQRFGPYLLIFAGSVVLTIIVVALSDVLHARDLPWFFVWNPTILTPMVAFNFLERTPFRSFYIAAIAVTGGYFILLLLAALVANKKRAATPSA